MRQPLFRIVRRIMEAQWGETVKSSGRSETETEMVSKGMGDS